MKKSHVLLIVIFIGLTFILSACVPGPRVTGTPGIALSDEMAFVAYGNFIYGMDIATGAVEWHYPEEANNQIVFYARPLVTNGFVYVGDLANNFHKLNIDTGKAEWTFSEASGYYIGQPAEADGMIYAPCNDGSLYAIDINGDLVWEFETGHYIWAQPQIVEGTVYIGSMDHFVYAVSQEGDELWSTEVAGAVVGSPVLKEDNSVLYVGSIGGEMVALDAADGEILWTFDAEDSIWGSSILVDGTLYFADSGGNIYALDPENGEAFWRKTYDGSVVGGLVALEEGFALATDEGVVQAFDFDGTPVWQATPGGEIVQAPAVNDEYLVTGAINSDNLVYAFNMTGVQLWSKTPED
jgi:outer membrane protein assembly factor BamB